jgi:Avidin family
MFRLVVLSLMALGLACAGASAQNLPTPSTWVNARGSILTVSSMDGSGKFAGTYVNKASGFGCQNSPYPLSGTNTGNSVNFVVTWNNESTWNQQSNCLSVTAWQGTLAGTTITAQWQLARGNPQTGQLQTLTGQDTFTQQ